MFEPTTEAMRSGTSATESRQRHTTLRRLSPIDRATFLGSARFERLESMKQQLGDTPRVFRGQPILQSEAILEAIRHPKRADDTRNFKLYLAGNPLSVEGRCPAPRTQI